MRCWLFFHHDLTAGHPETPEIRRFQRTAQQLRITLDILKPQDFDLVVDATHGWTATYHGRKLAKPDMIISRTGSETSYFMLAVLRHFEHQGVMMVNSAAAIEAVADKLHSMQLIAAAGLPTPKTILGKFPVDVTLVERELGFPVVIKTLRGTRGSGVMLCESRQQFLDLAALLHETNPGTLSSSDIIFQQYIRASHGRDVRILVINGKAVAAMERRARNGGFKANVSIGGEAIAFNPPRAMAELAIRAADVLGLDVAGIDILFDKRGYMICEANSSPGFQGLERACGINVPALIFEEMQNRRTVEQPRQTGTFGRIRDWLRGIYVPPHMRPPENRNKNVIPVTLNNLL